MTSATLEGLPNAISAAIDVSKTYSDDAIKGLKNELLGGAGEAYDTLKELSVLINENDTAIDALREVATGKQDKINILAIENGGTGANDAATARSNLGAAPENHRSTTSFYGAADASYYGHAKASSTTPKENGTAYVGSEASSFARGDHVHPKQISVDHVDNSISIKLNGSNEVIFDGSVAKSIDITPNAIGAQATITGAASSVTANLLTPYRMGISSGDGNIAVSSNIYADGDRIAINSQTKPDVNLYINGSTKSQSFILSDEGGSIGYSQTTDFATKSGYTTLVLGNAKKQSEDEGNLRGKITIYSPNDKYTNIYAADTLSESTALYLPPVAGTLVTHSTGNQIGSSIKPIYINTQGQAIACQTPASGAWFSGVSFVNSSGVMDIGRFIDFHGTNTTTKNYSTRIDAGSDDAENILYLPDITGQVVVHTNDTTVGGTYAPVYIDSSGKVVSCSSPSMLVNLGSTTASTVFKQSPRPGVTGTLPIANGGTGSTTASGARAYLGAAHCQIQTTAATGGSAGWYRIAQSIAGIDNVVGTFEIKANVSGYHSTTTLMAGTSFGKGSSIQQLSHHAYSNPGISQARIVYAQTYNQNYAYLEVYQPQAVSRAMTVKLVEGFGWTPIVPTAVAESVSSGYLCEKITLTSGIASSGTIFSETTSTEAKVGVKGPAGSLHLYSHDSADENRGLYGYNANGQEKTYLEINQENKVFLRGTADNATLLKPTEANATGVKGTWLGSMPSTGKVIWREAFTHSDLNSDSGDIVFWMANHGTNEATLNVLIDGCFYQNGQNGLYKVLDENMIVTNYGTQKPEDKIANPQAGQVYFKIIS